MTAEMLTRPLVRDLGELRERMTDLVTGAVDVLEVTAGLEAEGIGDKIAREYGEADVFTLAARLYDESVRRPKKLSADPNPWAVTTSVWRHGGRYVVRGLLFGLPGAGYVAISSLLGQKSAGLVLTLSLVLCWPVSQGIAALAYSRPSPSATRRVLRMGVVYGVPFMTLVSLVLGQVLGSGYAVIAVACAQSVYLLAATAALVMGAELWLLLALMPGVAVTFSGLPGQLVIVGWAVTGAAVLAIALERTAGSARSGVSWAALRLVAPYALFGLLAGGLLTFTIVAAYAGYGAPPASTSAAMVALSVSMGPAEWVLHSFRARGHELLKSSHSLRMFVIDVRLTLFDLLCRFLAALGVLLGGAILLADQSGGVQTFCCYLLLGGALVVALMLQSCGQTAASLVCCSLTLAVEMTVMFTAAPDPGSVQLAGAVVLFTVLLSYAVVVLGRATCHR